MEYRTASDPASPFETQVIKHDVFSTTLDGLTPSTEYDVRVRGENAVGRSVPSVTMRTKTKDNGEFLGGSGGTLKMFFSLWLALDLPEFKSWDTVVHHM